MNEDYTDLEVRQESRKPASEIYMLIKSYPKEELFGLTNQTRRSAVSIASNIAEGCGRQTFKDTINFLHIASGSLYEPEAQILISLDQEYISKIQLDSAYKSIQTCERLLNGFINYYRKIQ